MSTTDLYLSLVRALALFSKLLCVDDVENFFLVTVETFKNDEVFLWLLDPDNIDDLILVGYFKRQHLFANLAISLVELEHDLTLVNLSLAFRFKR